MTPNEDRYRVGSVPKIYLHGPYVGSDPTHLEAASYRASASSHEATIGRVPASLLRHAWGFAAQGLEFSV